jgi:hypothetical protein
VPSGPITIFLFCPRRLRLLNWGVLFDERRSLTIIVHSRSTRGDSTAHKDTQTSLTLPTHARTLLVRASTVVLRSVGRVNCCSPSPAQSALVSGPVGTHAHIFVLSKTFTCFEIGPPLRLTALFLGRSGKLLLVIAIRVILGHLPGSSWSWLGGRSEFSFRCWPASDVEGRNCGFCVADPRGPPRGRLVGWGGGTPLVGGSSD